MRLWPKSPKSPKSPASPNSPEPSKHLQSPTFSKTRENYYGVHQCAGCDNVDRFIRKGVDGRSFAILHNNFEELENCAQKCGTCRVFRQSVVLEQVTYDGYEKLQKMQGTVKVRWQETVTSGDPLGSYLRIELEGALMRPGVIDLNHKEDVGHLALRSNPVDSAVIAQAKGWLDTCRNTHTGDCDNLSWSDENPRLLIEIESPTSIRLRENQAGEYVALSYCWGIPNGFVLRARTVISNLERRRQSFLISDFPATVRDAIHIIFLMGIQYAWIDALCVVQDDLIDGKPKGVETMHKVYSNALFTLCACATTGATEQLLGHREAWTRKTEPCRLGGRWLTTSDMSLNELRLRSPLAGRAWTLQEERLSPRMLYISSTRMYWSCAKGHEMEVKPTYPRPNKYAIGRPVYAISDRNNDIPQPQQFLLACYNGERERLHTYWVDIVKSYASRDMGNRKDRLIALSGLAARYLSASSPNEYLAGLWANDLARGLSWKVKQATSDGFREVPPRSEWSSWPSWSWAVLPLQTEIDMDSESAKSPYFEHVQFVGIQDTITHTNVEDATNRGQNVKTICVKGRIRELWKPSSRHSEWSTVSKSVDGDERFTFAGNLGRDTHAVDAISGRVLVYEDRKREVISQLDFQSDVKWVQLGQLYLYAFEIGVSSMLVLEHRGEGMWRRVGVAWNVRRDFFASAQCQTLYMQ
jgi:hypothetical protein